MTIQVVVPDSSALRKLKHSGITELIFQLPLKFIVSDLFYRRELEKNNGYSLKKFGLEVTSVESRGVQKAQDYHCREPSLTLSDCFALALAYINQWTLLTECTYLQALAGRESVNCCNVKRLLKFHDLMNV